MPQTIDNMLAVWSNSLTTYSGIKMNVQGPGGGAEQSSASSLLMDLQVGGVSRFKVNKDGSLTMLVAGGDTAPHTIFTNASGYLFFSRGGNTGVGFYEPLGHVNVINTGQYGFAAGPNPNSADAVLTRRGTANLRLGAADAAAPVAQTLSVQSVVAGTTNTAGANLTITGSQGTGTGAGGSIVFQVAPAGSSGTAQNALVDALTINSAGRAAFTTSSGTGLYINDGAAGIIYMRSSDVQRGYIQFAANGLIELQTANSQLLSLGSSGTAGIRLRINGQDSFLHNDAANTLALRNGASPQSFRVYNTTDGTNSEFGKIAWSSNVLQIGTEKAGTGTARTLEFQTDGTTRLTIAATGAVTLAGGINLGGSINLNGSTEATRRLVFNGVGFIKWPSNGIMLLQNDAQTDFGRLQFGGTTSSFPALKRSSTTLQARLADDSAFASVQGKITTDTAYTAGDPTTTGYLVVYDSTGTAYRVPAVLN